MFVIDPREDLETGERTKPFCIICHPKTGSQSVREALRRKYNARVVRGQHFLDEDECKRIILDGGIVCSVVRNPWDLMISWYFYSEHDPKQGKDVLPFSQWLDNVLTSGNGWIEHGLFYGLDHCNRIIRFEHDIQSQLNGCLIDCGLEPVALRNLGKTSHTHYSNYYSIQDAIKVYSRFADDIEEWGYQFENV